MTTFQGRCHCGQTEWEATLEEGQQSHVLCHCGACQLLSGGAITSNQVIPKSALKFTKGGDALKEYTYTGDSGKPVHCYYCPNCTSHPYHHQTVRGDDVIVLRTIFLQGAKENFKPIVEVYGKDRMAWEKEVAKTFDTGPS